MKIVDKLFKDKDGKIVLGQTPNLPIILAMAFWVTSLIIYTGEWHSLLYLLFLGFLGWWAILELLQGVNYFRRLLGLLGLIYIAVRLSTIYL